MEIKFLMMQNSALDAGNLSLGKGRCEAEAEKTRQWNDEYSAAVARYEE